MQFCKQFKMYGPTMKTTIQVQILTDRYKVLCSINSMKLKENSLSAPTIQIKQHCPSKTKF
jgi:hypothetical protein